MYLYGVHPSCEPIIIVLTFSLHFYSISPRAMVVIAATQKTKQ